jgi:Protein of unknown function (DUF4239)
MDLYWLYDIESWQLFLVIGGGTAAFSILGCLFFRDRTDRWLSLQDGDNETVGQFLAFTGVFFGITLGLIAVTAWENYTSAQDKVGMEGAALAAFYRDISHLDEPVRTRLRNETRRLAKQTVNHDWGLQAQGIVPTGGGLMIANISDILFNYQSPNPSQAMVQAEAMRQFNVLVERRSLRLQSVTDGLPSTLWFVLVLGAIINILLTWLFVIKNRKLDVIINLLVGLLLGSVLFFIVAMDNPYRGKLSVDVDPIEDVLRSVMR